MRVLGGLVLALVPAVPDVELAPELVFLLFLSLPTRARAAPEGAPRAGAWSASVLVINLGACWFPGDIALRMAAAQEVSPEQAPGLHRLIEKLATYARLPKPRAAIIDACRRTRSRSAPTPITWWWPSPPASWAS